MAVVEVYILDPLRKKPHPIDANEILWLGL